MSQVQTCTRDRNCTSLSDVQVSSCSLWIIGEYSASEADIAAALDTVKGAIGPLPLFREDDGTAEGEENGNTAPAPAQVCCLQTCGPGRGFQA